MDFTKFSDENFDLKEWINSAFTAQKDTNQNAEQFSATLVTKLQVFIQEINNSIDETSQQTVQNFPRILREIDVLKQEVFMLKEQMKNVKEDLLKVEKNTVNESMKLLLDLDIMRTNMLNVQLALQEANNWTNLSSDLDSILQTKDLNKISNHIEAMQNSLNMLEDDSSDYVSRCTLLEDFKNKFESLMSADIIAAFNSKSIDISKNYVQIFEQMNRLNDLKKYYHQCEKVKILERLTSIIPKLNLNPSSSNSVVFTIDSGSSKSSGEQLKELLKNWLDYLIEVWHNEIQWCKQIFNDSQAIVINLLTKCYEEFNKSFSNLVEDFANDNKNESNCLETLTQLKLETDRFSQTIYSSAESSNQLKNNHLNDLIYKLFQQVYLPFKTNSKRYTNQIVKYLQFQLESTIKMNHPDTSECVQLLSNSVTKVFNLIEKEIDRCLTLSNACGFSMLIESLKIFLKSYIEEFKRVVLNLKERKNENTSVPNYSTPALNSAHTTHTGHLHSQISKSSGAEDWDTFRHFVRIIQIVGDLMVKYESLEENLEKKIQTSFIHKASASVPSTPTITSTTSPSFPTIPQNFQSDHSNQQMSLLSINNLKEYLLDDSDRIKLNTLIQIIESGDDYSIMKDLLKPLYLLSENVHKYAFDIVFSPVKHLLSNISKANAWNKGDNKQIQENVPLFAFAPQEFITKIGQYLLTLPQNFEPFTMQDNSNLIVALRKGKLPFLDEKDLSDDITACWLDSIANATVIALCEEILKIQQIPINSQRQLIIDIEYMTSVFEDVGLKDFNNLQYILNLLKVEKEGFEDLAKNKPVRIVSSVRKMRNI